MKKKILLFSAAGIAAALAYYFYSTKNDTSSISDSTLSEPEPPISTREDLEKYLESQKPINLDANPITLDTIPNMGGQGNLDYVLNNINNTNTVQLDNLASQTPSQLVTLPANTTYQAEIQVL